jgi:hypothetical protein
LQPLSESTAGKYIEAAKPPAETASQAHLAPTVRPVAGIWERAERMLEKAPELGAKELFE